MGTTNYAETHQDLKVLLEKGRTLFQQKHYDDAIAVFDYIDKHFGRSRDANIREKVATALGLKGLALSGKGYRGKAIEIWEEADRRYRKDGNPDVRVRLSQLLYNRIYTLVGLSIRGPYKNQQAEFDAAMVTFNEFDQRYGKDKDPAIREMAAWALFQKAMALVHRQKDEHTDTCDFSPYRTKEAVAVIDEMVRRYGEDKEPSVRAVLAKALFEKGGIFYQIGKTQEENAVYDELDRRFGQDEAPDVRVIVIEGLVGKAWRLVQKANTHDHTEDDYAPAISIMDEIVERFGKDNNAKVQEQVIDVLLKKADILCFVKEKTPIKRIVAIYDNIDQLYGKNEAPAIRAKVAKTLCDKGLLLARKQPKAALAAFEEVDKRYAMDEAPAVREQVANALIEKGKLFIEQKQRKKALAAFDQVIHRYKGEIEMNRVVDLAEFHKKELSNSRWF